MEKMSVDLVLKRKCGSKAVLFSTHYQASSNSDHDASKTALVGAVADIYMDPVFCICAVLSVHFKHLERILSNSYFYDDKIAEST